MVKMADRHLEKYNLCHLNGFGVLVEFLFVVCHLCYLKTGLQGTKALKSGTSVGAFSMSKRLW